MEIRDSHFIVFVVMMATCVSCELKFEEWHAGGYDNFKYANGSEQWRQWMPYREAYPWHLPDCSRQINDSTMPDFTVVTALIDINRHKWPRFRRPLEYYLAYAIPLLNLNIPLITLVDRRVVDFIKFFRQGKEHLTRIIPLDIKDLEYYHHLEKVAQIMSSDDFKENHHLIDHPEGFSPEYNIVVNSKSSLLYEMSKLDPFHTQHFFWLDFGYGHMDDIFPHDCAWAPNNIMNSEDKLTFIMINKIEYLSSMFDLYKEELPPFFGGGFFGGSKKAVKKYYELHREVFEILVEYSVIDDDQTLAIAAYFKQPELFNLVEGWWHDAFKLFH